MKNSQKNKGIEKYGKQKKYREKKSRKKRIMKVQGGGAKRD